MHSPPLPIWTPWYDLDMTKFEDEQLVILVQECVFEPARDELISRYGYLRECLINHHAARSRLQEADRQDIEQEAVLWTLEAIYSYDTEEHLNPHGCRFRSFLYRVIKARLIDAERQRTNHQDHYTLSVVLFAGLSPEADRRRNGNEWAAVDAAFRLSLQEEVDHLEECDQQFLDLLMKGTSLREVAAMLDISYDMAKRRRRKIFATLQTAFLAEDQRM